ncbi:MAG: hypothetical protein WDM76_00945 [Limisphaerales bacterium]
MTSIAVMPTWELLQTTNVTDAQLAVLQKGWERTDFLSDATNAFVMERAWGLAEIGKIRATHYEFGRMVGMIGSMSGSGGSSIAWTWPPDWEAITERPRYAVGEAMWRSSWSYSDELRMLKGNSIILETLRTMQTNQSQFYKADYDAMTARLSSLGITNAGAAFFHALKIPDFGEIFSDMGFRSAVQKVIRMETVRRVIITAIVLKRFHLKHGKLPEALDELVPEFSPSISIDPFDGKSLKYHPNIDGTFLLYSVGENGVDDGGDPALEKGVTSSSFNWQNPHALDWVWPQPATEEEIQKYYEEHSGKSK